MEIGEYVRTKDGIIDKVIKYDETLEEYWCEKGLIIDIKNKIATYFKDIVKHSKNIIDLIEIDDVVKVLDIDRIRIFKIDDEDELESFKEDIFQGNWKLLSIVTKERFKESEYVVN